MIQNLEWSLTQILKSSVNALLQEAHLWWVILLPKLDFLFQHTPPAKASSSFKFQLKSFLLSGVLPDTPFSPETKEGTCYLLCSPNLLHTFIMDFIKRNSNCLSVYPSPPPDWRFLKAACTNSLLNEYLRNGLNSLVLRFQV